MRKTFHVIELFVGPGFPRFDRRREATRLSHVRSLNTRKELDAYLCVPSCTDISCEINQLPEDGELELELDAVNEALQYYFYVVETGVFDPEENEVEADNGDIDGDQALHYHSLLVFEGLLETV